MIINISISSLLKLVVVFGVCIAAAELIAYGLKVLVLGVLVKLRKRKRDRRIIRQAKAAGAWDLPWKLGGRALELKAEGYKIKRKPGETDACLRIRCMAAYDEEKEDAPKSGGRGK